MEERRCCLARPSPSTNIQPPDANSRPPGANIQPLHLTYSQCVRGVTVATGCRTEELCLEARQDSLMRHLSPPPSPPQSEISSLRGQLRLFSLAGKRPLLPLRHVFSHLSVLPLGHFPCGSPPFRRSFSKLNSTPPPTPLFSPLLFSFSHLSTALLLALRSFFPLMFFSLPSPRHFLPAHSLSRLPPPASSHRGLRRDSHAAQSR